GAFFHLFDVSTRGESAADTGDDNGANLRVSIKLLGGNHDVVHGLRVQRVERFGAVQRDPAHTAAGFGEDRFKLGHVRLSSCATLRSAHAPEEARMVLMMPEKSWCAPSPAAKSAYIC